jgi:hypothetical protein
MHVSPYCQPLGNIFSGCSQEVKLYGVIAKVSYYTYGRE